jgi:hypothetical protein
MKRSSLRKSISVSHSSKQVIDEANFGQRNGFSTLLKEPSFSSHAKELFSKKIMKSVINLTKRKSKMLVEPMPGPSGRNIMKIFERKPTNTKAARLGKLNDVIGEMLERVSKQNIDCEDLDHSILAHKKSSMNVIGSSLGNLPGDTAALRSNKNRSNRKEMRQQRKITFKLLDFLKTKGLRHSIHPRDNPQNDQSDSSKSLETKSNVEKIKACYPRMDDETGLQWEARIKRVMMRKKDVTMIVESQDKFKKYRSRTLAAKKKGICVNMNPNEFPKSPSPLTTNSRAGTFNEVPVVSGTLGP